MLYVQQFHHDRQHHLKEYERLRSAADHNFLLCSNQYAGKLAQLSQPATRASTPNLSRERTRAILILTRIQSLVSLQKNNNNDLSILNITEKMIDGHTNRTHFYVSMQQPGIICAVNVLPNETLEVQGQRVRAQPDSFWSYYPGDVGILCKRASSWNPQQSRITRENKDYMTALAKGLSRPNGKQLSNENGEVFSSRWHHHLSNSVYRPGTGKSGSRGNRPPTSAPERGKMFTSTLIEMNRPTTAPVNIEERPRRMNRAKVKSAAPTRPPPPPPPSAPLRAPRLIDSSENFDNLINPTFLHLTDGLKSSIYKGDNNFVHKLCSNPNDNFTEQLSTSRDSFLDASNGSIPAETVSENPPSNESDQDENKSDNFQHVVNLGAWHRDAKSGRIEAVANLPTRKVPPENPDEIERRIIEQEDEQLRQRQDDIDQYTFDLTPEPSIPFDDYKSPFTEEYDQAIAFQSQLQTVSGNNEWTFKDFYRDVKTPYEQETNTKAVFEKCIKLARLQANTIKGEQRRRQNMNTYNRLIRNNALDTSISNLTASFSSKTTTNNTDRELNELKRELRCNECKRITCLGNCAPGQDYHLYKRIVTSIPSQSSSSKQASLVNGSSGRDHHRCKHSCTTCSTSNCRTTADIINANAIMTNLNNNNNNRLRSSKTTYSYGQKSQRPAVDLRPRSMHQVTREMKTKFEQANLSPVVVVPLFEEESQSMFTKRTQRHSTNGLLPGKSFRSQRRDSLTLISPPKIFS